MIFLNLKLNDKKSTEDLSSLKEQYYKAKKDIQTRFEDKVDKIERGDELLPGVNEDGKSICRNET